METLVVYQKTDGKRILNAWDFFLGKFIYIMDAFDDVEKDIASGSYNALKDRLDTKISQKNVISCLNMMMAECTIEFEKLPCIQDVEILRNILYAGVWKKFDKKAGRKETQGKEIKMETKEGGIEWFQIHMV